jgi:hypothetical protein
MPDVTWPSILRAGSYEWEMISNAKILTSPITKTSVILDLPGGLWGVTLTFNNANPEKTRALRGVLGALNGPVNRTLMPDYSYLGPAGEVGGNGTITANADAYVGQIIWANGAGRQFKQGDIFGANNRRYVVVEDTAISGSSGIVSVRVWPSFRENMSNVGLTRGIVGSTPVSTWMRLVDNDQARLAISAPRIGSSTLNFIEALP